MCAHASMLTCTYQVTGERKKGEGKARQWDKVVGAAILASQRRPQTDRDENREGVSYIYVCEKGWRWGHALQGSAGKHIRVLWLTWDVWCPTRLKEQPLREAYAVPFSFKSVTHKAQSLCTNCTDLRSDAGLLKRYIFSVRHVNTRKPGE